MIGLPLKESTRAAALDGALSFSILLQNQRELTLDTAQSSVNGLLSAILAAPADYGRLLEAANTAFATQSDAALRLSQPPWAPASTTVQEAIRTSLDQAYAADLDAAKSGASQALVLATGAKTNAASDSTAEAWAGVLEHDAARLLDALAALAANQDASGVGTIASTREEIADVLQQAQARLVGLENQSPAPTTQIASTRQVIAAAQATLAAADQARRTASSALTGPAGNPPTTFQLTTSTPPPTYLSTWGDSGAITLTDETGKGIVITSEGKVDTLPPSGDGWQFKTDSTFLLPDGTKITVSPGSPATVLATRGQQQLQITALAPGLAPTVALSASGGLEADQAQNDGYVFQMGASQQAWTLSGALLGGNAGNREVVATTPLTNEQVVDVTNVTLDPALVAKLQSLGIDPAAFDANHDGLFNNEELRTLVTALDSAVTGASIRFESAIKTASTASDSLLRLNQFLEKVLDDADRHQAKREESVAQDREQLLQIQRDLEESRAALLAAAATKPATGAPASNSVNVLSTARVVLNELKSFGSETQAENSPSMPIPSSNVLHGLNSGAFDPSASSAQLLQSFRRAERLLSGLGGGNSRRVLEPPPQNPGAEQGGVVGPTPNPSAPGDIIPSALPPTGTNATALNPLAPPDTESPAAVSPESIPTPASSVEPASRFGSPMTGQDLSATPGPETDASPNPRASFVKPTSSEVSELQTPLTGTEAPLPFPATLTPVPPGLIPPASAANEPVVQAEKTPKEDVGRTAPPTRIPATAPSGLTPLPGTGYPATGPDTNVAPDPTFGSSDGFIREFRRRLDQHVGTHREQTARAQLLQSSVREVVEHFVTLVSKDEELRQVINGDDLSDDQRRDLKTKVADLERNLGLSWGGDPVKTPDGEANLTARVLNSGMMI